MIEDDDLPGDGTHDAGAGNDKGKALPPSAVGGTVVKLTEIRALTHTEKRRRRQRRESAHGGGDTGGDGDAAGPPVAAAEVKQLRGALALMHVLEEVGYEVSQDLFGQGVVTLQDPNRSTFFIDSRAFRSMLRLLYGERRRVTHQRGRIRDMTTKRAIDEVCETLKAQAYGTPRRDYRRRVVAHGGLRWLDLCQKTDDWRMLRIGPESWVVEHRYSANRMRSDVPLIRDDDMLPLVMPDPRKKDEAWRQFRERCAAAGMSGDDSKMLIFAMLAVWRPGVPGPLAILVGPPGTFKTSLLRLVQKIVDPVVGGLWAMPVKRDDLIVTLARGPSSFFDNVTVVTREQSDLLCQNATGGGSSEREFFTQHQRARASFQSITFMTALSSPIEALDLGTRAVVMHTKHVAGGEIVPEADLAKRDNEICAGMVAKLADAVQMELKNQHRSYPGVGRLADFERGSRAAAAAFGWTDADIAALFRRKAGEVQDQIVEADPLIAALRDHLRKQAGGSDGAPLAGRLRQRKTAHQWWLALLDHWPQLRSRDTNFPQSAAQFSRRLSESADALAAEGITVVRVVIRGERLIELRLGADEYPELLADASIMPPGGSRRPTPAPGAPCAGCGGKGWWWADQSSGEWRCRGCEPMPPEVSNLHEWPPPLRH